MRLRNRMIKATYYTDPDLCRMPRAKREFYRSLWTCAEDSACLEDDMFGVKLSAWPSPNDRDMSVDKFEKWRDELLACGKLVAYEANGQPYLYIPAMAIHEKPRNPQSPDYPLPEWVEWIPHHSDLRKGSYKHHIKHGDAYYDAYTTHQTCNLTVPALPCPVLKDNALLSQVATGKPLSSSTKIPDQVLGYWCDKTGRDPKPADLKSLRSLCKHFPVEVVNLAIGQAVAQGSAADNFALITAIAKKEVA